MLEVQNLYKTFGATRAIDNLTFRAEPGEIVGLIGHNGAGKTTTFRVLAGLMKPDSGSARVGGYDCVQERVSAQAELGVLPDVRGLYPRLTGREHLEYYGHLHELEGEELVTRIDAFVERLGMEDFVERRAKGYSRGQELKIALARAMIHAPDNYIFDEPTNGLDVPSARAVHKLIRELSTQGASIIVSSHIMSEVAVLCDRLVIMTEGRVVLEGTPEELKRRTGEQDLEEIFLIAMTQLAAAE